MTDFKKNYLIKSDLSDLSESDTIQKLVKSSKYIDTSIVNGLRRYIISRINTLAFDYSHVPMETEYITFKKNTSEMNNDFIGHRIGLLPIKIVYIKYLLFIYKIIIGHHNELNELLDENDETIIHNKLKTLLKLSNQNNIELIQQFIFYIKTTTNNDLEEITTKNIQLKFSNSTIKISDYIDKLKKYSKLINIYNKNNSIEIDLDKLNETLIIQKIFPEFVVNDSSYGILIAKIKKFSVIDCEFKLNIGNGQKHSRFNTVAPCSYSFIIDKTLASEVLEQKINEANLSLDDLKKNINISSIIDFIQNRYLNIIDFNLSKDLVNQRNLFLKDPDYDYDIDDLEPQQFEFLKDYILEKDTLISNFNKCEIQRYYLGKEEYNVYQRQFDFFIQSNHFYDSDKILKKGFKLLKKDLITFINNIIYALNESSINPINYNNIIIDSSEKITNGIDIIDNNGDHTIGNIISSYIYYYYFSDKSLIEFVSYKMIHPLKTTLLITIGFNQSIDNLNNNLLEIFTNLKNIFEDFDLFNFIN